MDINDNMIVICSDLLDTLTAVKGFIQLKTEDKTRQDKTR